MLCAITITCFVFFKVITFPEVFAKDTSTNTSISVYNARDSASRDSLLYYEDKWAGSNDTHKLTVTNSISHDKHTSKRAQVTTGPIKTNELSPLSTTSAPSPSPTVLDTMPIFNISLLAGRHGWNNQSGIGGPATSASFGNNRGIWVSTDSSVYFTDFSYKCVYRVDTAGIINLFAGNGVDTYDGDGGLAVSASFRGPWAIWGDSAGSVYVTDTVSGTVRRIITSMYGDLIVTFAGVGGDSVFNGDSGPATSITIGDCHGIIGDTTGNLYVGSGAQNRLKRIGADGITTTIAGNGDVASSGNGGPASSATVNYPGTVWIDSRGDLHWVELNKYYIRVLVKTSSTVEHVTGTGDYVHAGDGGPISSAAITYARGMWGDSLGNIYFGEAPVSCIRRMDVDSGMIFSVAGVHSFGALGDGGLAIQAQIHRPFSLYGHHDSVWIADSFNQLVRKLSPAVTTTAPTLQPSSGPSSAPSSQPSSQPSSPPTTRPSNQPSRQPSSQPSAQPAVSPTSTPSSQPWCHPTGQPTGIPSVQPSKRPSMQPTAAPSTQPTCSPSVQPSSQPSTAPSRFPSGHPSSEPSGQPSITPTVQPTCQPTALPTGQPSCSPSGQPSGSPSVLPSSHPSALPSGQPSSQPSAAPSGQPSGTPSNQPSCVPSGQPSRQPTCQPTARPLTRPSSQPSCTPSAQPSSQPLVSPSGQPSSTPTLQPSAQPSVEPSSLPTSAPSAQPSSAPSAQPSNQPSQAPTTQPSSSPTVEPSRQPSSIPSLLPTGQPSSLPSELPSAQPTSTPTAQPTCYPTMQPTALPSSQPSGAPTCAPLSQPSRMPSRAVIVNHGGTLPGNHSISVLCLNHSEHIAFKVVLPYLRTQTVSGDGYQDVMLNKPTVGLSYVLLGSSALSNYVNLPTDNSFYLVNSKGYDFSGRSVANAGDLNGDGYDDLIIGVPFASKVYVLFASLHGFQNMTHGFTVFGARTNDLTGWSVSYAGDVNNDTIADIVLGAPSAVNEGNSRTGAIYVLYGSAALGSTDIHLHSLNNTSGFVMYGAADQDMLGVSVSAAGDVNGDHCDDVIVGALRAKTLFSGAAYIIHGCTVSFASASDFHGRGRTLYGTAWSSTGYSVSGTGDVNGDGLSDVIIGSLPFRSTYTAEFSYLVYGKSHTSAEAVLLVLSNMTVSEGAVMSGGGIVVTGLGDLSGDQLSEVMISTQLDLSAGSGFAVYSPMRAEFNPTRSPTASSSASPSRSPTVITSNPSLKPTMKPTLAPSVLPTQSPTQPTVAPSMVPSGPTFQPTVEPTQPTSTPSALPTAPTMHPSLNPTAEPSEASFAPTEVPSCRPTVAPSATPIPTVVSSSFPFTALPIPTRRPIAFPTMAPTDSTSDFTMIYISSEGTYTRKDMHTHYIVNSTGDVRVVGTSSHAVYIKVLPNAESSLFLDHYNTSSDKIDLTTFHTIKSFGDLNSMFKDKELLSRRLQSDVDLGGNAVASIHLPDNQRIIIYNLTTLELSESCFVFAEPVVVNNVDDKSNRAIDNVFIASAAIGGTVVCFMLCFLTYKVIHYCKESDAHTTGAAYRNDVLEAHDGERTFVTYIELRDQESLSSQIYSLLTGDDPQSRSQGSSTDSHRTTNTSTHRNRARTDTDFTNISSISEGDLASVSGAGGEEDEDLRSEWTEDIVAYSDSNSNYSLLSSITTISAPSDEQEAHDHQLKYQYTLADRSALVNPAPAPSLQDPDQILYFTADELLERNRQSFLQTNQRQHNSNSGTNLAALGLSPVTGRERVTSFNTHGNNRRSRFVSFDSEPGGNAGGGGAGGGGGGEGVTTVDLQQVRRRRLMSGAECSDGPYGGAGRSRFLSSDSSTHRAADVGGGVSPLSHTVSPNPATRHRVMSSSSDYYFDESVGEGGSNSPITGINSIRKPTRSRFDSTDSVDELIRNVVAAVSDRNREDRFMSADSEGSSIQRIVGATA